MRIDRDVLRTLLLKNAGGLLGGEIGTLARFGFHEEQVLQMELEACFGRQCMEQDAKKLDAARAEVERLRGKLAEVEGERDRGEISFEKYKAEATTRVRSMRDAAANVALGWRGGSPMTAVIAAAIGRLPLDAPPAIVARIEKATKGTMD